MRHILTLKRSSYPQSLISIVDRFNTTYRYIERSYIEEISGPNEADRSLLRDAVLEGFLLGLQWAIGGADETELLMSKKGELSQYLYNNPSGYGRT